MERPAGGGAAAFVELDLAGRKSAPALPWDHVSGLSYVASFWSERKSTMTITAAQCRSARTLLSWSVSRLASAASINRCEIDDFELERRVPHTQTRETIRHALEAAGIVFLPHDDVMMHRGGAQSSDCRGDDGGLPVAPLSRSASRRVRRFPTAA